MASAARARVTSLAAGLMVLRITRMTRIMESENMAVGAAWCWFYTGLYVFLVLFAGLMSRLFLVLISITLVDLEIPLRSGTNDEKTKAAAIFSVVQKQHQLLVTLLLCNVCAMEALPTFLDRIFNPVLSIVLSVTFVLVFGEVIPQAICARYGLAVGSSFVWLVRVLMTITYPIAYPSGKLLDIALGNDESTLLRQAQLKVLVATHSKEARKGGKLN